MKWMKRNKCKVCNKKIIGNIHEIRLQTYNGILELKICDKCADFFDKSAEILRKHARDKNDTV